MLLNELKTVFRRRRTIALLVGLAALPVVISIAIFISNGPDNGGGPPFLSQVSSNGFFAALVGLSVVVPFFLPLTVAVVSGDTIAGEANMGTLRYILTRPVSRTKLLAAKYVSCVAFAVAAALVVSISGLIAGSIFFGIHEVVSLSGNTLSLADASGRALMAAGIVALSTCGLIAIGLFISTLTEQPVGAMAAITVFAIVSQVLDSISQLDVIHPYLFTHNWFGFVDLFRVPLSWSSIFHDLLLQLGWGFVFASAAWARFTTKDVLA